MALLAFASTSCKEDTEPRLNTPGKFVLNTPSMANLPYLLTAQSSVNLTVSQPDYGGVAVVPVYSVLASYDETLNFDENGQPANFVELEGRYTTAAFSIPGEALAMAICSLSGYDTPESFSDAPRKVYLAVKAEVPNCNYSVVYSNVICLASVTPYFAVKLPAKIYLVGAPQGWDINSSAMTLSEADDAIGSNVFTGTFTISADDAAGGFRFYTALGNWGDNGALPSIGAAADDGDNQSVAVNDQGIYQGACVNGKGNWNVSNWPGGDMKITVNLNNMRVVFEKVN